MSVSSAATGALVEIGPVVVPALIDALKYSDENVRNHIAVLLGNKKLSAKKAIPVLIDALEDHDTGVRSAAANALVKIGAIAVPALIDALKDTNRDVQRAAVNTLGRIGPRASQAVPELKAIKKYRPDDAALAEEALEKIQGRRH